MHEKINKIKKMNAGGGGCSGVMGGVENNKKWNWALTRNRACWA